MNVRIILLVSAFNGLSQRVWCALRDAGHDVGVLLAVSAPDMIDEVYAAQPDLVLCPYLKERVPAEIWQRWRTVIIHPGPVGDRGPSSLDWAISEGLAEWGVTALQAVEELDAGPIWATRTFAMPADPLRKSALYNGAVADAAVACAFEVVAKAADPSFVPTPAAAMPQMPGARLRPPMRQSDRRFDWDEPSARVIRTIRAADGVPGVRTRLAGLEVFAYDAHPGPGIAARPGAVLRHHDDAALVATGDGSVWVGHLRLADPQPGQPGTKLPAATVLGSRLDAVEYGPADDSFRQVRYRRHGPVGWIEFDFYNGAMSPSHCRRLLAALRYATTRDTHVLVLVSGTLAFSNGIHLNVTDASANPARAAWENIRAVNDVCREIIGCTGQTVIAGYAGSAGAGGVMLGLGADIVAARSGIVLNPYYDIGLHGSELHTLTLPARVGADTARRLLEQRLPVSAERAHSLGLVDQIGPRDPGAYRMWLADLADRCATLPVDSRLHQGKQLSLEGASMPSGAYEARELAEMSRDMFEDRSGFAAARHAFVGKIRPAQTPARLRLPAITTLAAVREPARV